MVNISLERSLSVGSGISHLSNRSSFGPKSPSISPRISHYVEIGRSVRSSLRFAPSPFINRPNQEGPVSASQIKNFGPARVIRPKSSPEITIVVERRSLNPLKAPIYRPSFISTARFTTPTEIQPLIKTPSFTPRIRRHEISSPRLVKPEPIAYPEATPNVVKLASRTKPQPSPESAPINPSKVKNVTQIIEKAVQTQPKLATKLVKELKLLEPTKKALAIEAINYLTSTQPQTQPVSLSEQAANLVQTQIAKQTLARAGLSPEIAIQMTKTKKLSPIAVQVAEQLQPNQIPSKDQLEKRMLIHLIAEIRLIRVTKKVQQSFFVRDEIVNQTRLNTITEIIKELAKDQASDEPLDNAKIVSAIPNTPELISKITPRHQHDGSLTAIKSELMELELTGHDDSTIKATDQIISHNTAVEIKNEPVTEIAEEVDVERVLNGEYDIDDLKTPLQYFQSYARAKVAQLNIPNTEIVLHDPANLMAKVA